MWVSGPEGIPGPLQQLAKITAFRPYFGINATVLGASDVQVYLYSILGCFCKWRGSLLWVSLQVEPYYLGSTLGP